jgi:hypothetical protein
MPSGWFGSNWFVPTSSGGGGGPVVLTSNTTTIELLRDYIITLIQAITPTVHSGVRFTVAPDELAADFRAWAEQNPQGALRRFQVRDTGKRIPPDVSNTTVEGRFVEFEILIAYPQTNRFGINAARDRDDAAEADEFLIEQQVGMNGYANFTGASVPNAAWINGQFDPRVLGAGVDFVLMRATYRYWRRMVP